MSQTDVVRNHSIDIVNNEVLGHELALSLVKYITEFLSDISLLAVSSDILDDLTENAYTNTLVDSRALEIEALELLLGEACLDELLAINTAVTYYLVSFLGISDVITDLSSGVDIA